MTKRIAGGSKVEGGFYWNLKNWEIVPVDGKHGILPGTDKDAYAPVPSLAPPRPSPCRWCPAPPRSTPPTPSSAPSSAIAT